MAADNRAGCTELQAMPAVALCMAARQPFPLLPRRTSRDSSCSSSCVLASSRMKGDSASYSLETGAGWVGM